MPCAAYKSGVLVLMVTVVRLVRNMIDRYLLTKKVSVDLCVIKNEQYIILYSA